MEQQPNHRPKKIPHYGPLPKKEPAFKRDLVTYFVVNAFLWVIWFLTSRNHISTEYPWPVWPTRDGVSRMVIQYFEAYNYPQGKYGGKRV